MTEITPLSKVLKVFSAYAGPYLIREENSHNIVAPNVEIASSLGIIIREPVNNELGTVEEVNGKVYLFPDEELTSEFDVAFLVGSYLLFNKPTTLLTDDEASEAMMFALLTRYPDFTPSKYRDTASIIVLSRTIDVPYNAIIRASELF